MSGRTIWFSQDVARHRRGLMVELQDEFGPVALAVDVVLCSHAKMQNDGGAIREGFAAIAREAGMNGRADEVREFIGRAAAIGWLDDLEVDEDGRRFRCRVSGWRADQDRAGAAFRKQAQRTRADVTTRDVSRQVTECPPTGQDRTGDNPPIPPAGGRTRDRRLFDQQLDDYVASQFPDPRDPDLEPNVRGAVLHGARTHDEVVDYLTRYRPDLLGAERTPA